MSFEEAKLQDNVDKIKIIAVKKQAYLNIFFIVLSKKS
jgi:hypothetical protein